MVKRLCHGLVAVLLLAGLVFASASPALATAVDRVAFCNLEGRAGETIETEITLQGNETQERSGFWDTYYKQVGGDDARMDITSWITIEPEEYAIADGQTITFNLSVKIPADAEPGLWGATTKEAGLAGHSGERRTYIIYKDTITGGNVYSGLLIPISVIVLGEPTPEEEPANNVPPPPSNPSSQLLPGFIMDNLLVIGLGAVIIILLVVILTRRSAGRIR